jgi:hypothetical protein
MASPGLSEIVTTTLRNRSKKLADNVTKNNALLMRMSEKGRIKTVSGGRTIVQELEYAENGTYKRYSGYELLNIMPSDVFTAAEYDWKQAAVAVSISGLEQLQNSGPEAVIDLLESRIGNAERTMKNNISLDMYSTGAADGGKQIGGLQLLVADSSSSGTVGGISRSAWPFWRNKFIDKGTAWTSSNITTSMNAMYVQLVRGADKPDILISDNVCFTAYLESLQAIQRITDAKLGAAGFQTLQYMGGIPVVLDGGYGGGCPTNHMYFLNTDYFYYRPHKDRNMVPLEPDRFSVNQDAMVKLIGWAGNMTLSNAFLQGVIFT